MRQSRANAIFLFAAFASADTDFHPFKVAIGRADNKRVPNPKAPKKKRGK